MSMHDIFWISVSVVLIGGALLIFGVGSCFAIAMQKEANNRP